MASRLVARLALRVHPVPQVGGARGLERTEGIVRHLGAVAEEDVAVHVAVVRHRGPLVGAERGELAGLVLLVGDLHVLLPHRGRDLRVHQRLHRRARIELEQVGEDPVLLVLAGRVLHDHRLRRGQRAHVGPRRVGLLGDADVLRVIGHAHEVERRVDLDVEAHRVLDGLALRVLVGVGRAGDAVAHHPGIDRPAGVKVRLAEVRIALRVRLCRRRRCRSRLERGRGPPRRRLLRRASSATDLAGAGGSGSFFWQAPSATSARSRRGLRTGRELMTAAPALR